MPSAGISRPGYETIELYAPNRAPCRIDLSDNTNAWGMPPAAARAISESAANSVVRYPSLYATSLKEALSVYAGVPVGMITTGCGSDDVLDSAIRAFAEPGDAIAYPDPTFPMIPIFARMNCLVPLPIPMTAAFDIDVDQTVAAGARIIYLCSPNNPTGASLARESIEAVVNAATAKQVVIIDEAYAEFAGRNTVDLAMSHPRVIVTRTMSKAFGLAGLRVGYAIGNAALVAEVEKSRGPYKVNALAEGAAVAALRHDLGWVNEHIAVAVSNRQRLEEALASRGLSPVPSASNFVFVPVARAARLAACMRERGVAVRAFDAPEGLRITVGPWELLEEALVAFDEARRECE